MIVQAHCTSFIEELFSAIHDILVTDDIKLALYGEDAELSAATEIYTATGEITADGYTAGGISLAGAAMSGWTLTWDDAVFTGATITTARGALIYNASKANRAITVLDFGTIKTGTVASPLTVSF